MPYHHCSLAFVPASLIVSVPDQMVSVPVLTTSKQSLLMVVAAAETAAIVAAELLLRTVAADLCLMLELQW